MPEIFEDIFFFKSEWTKEMKTCKEEKAGKEKEWWGKYQETHIVPYAKQNSKDTLFF